MLPPGTRFVNTRICTMTPCGKWGVSDDGSTFYEVYHVVSSTPKSLMLMKAMLFHGDVQRDGNKLMDKLLDARACKMQGPILNEATTPRRYMLNKDEKGDYFVCGTGTDRRRIGLNGTHPVTYIADGVTQHAVHQAVALPSNNTNASRKRSRSVAA